MYNIYNLEEFNTSDVPRRTYPNTTIDNNRNITTLSQDVCFMCGGEHGNNQQCMREFY